MGLKEKLIKKQLSKMGYDFNDPKETTFRVIGNLITTSTCNYITPKEMVEFLEKHIDQLKKNL